MNVTRLEGIAYRPAGRTVLSGLDAVVGERERVGLIGGNGAGKSSLLRILAGEVEPDEGRIVMPRGLRVGHLPQDVVLPPGMRLIEAALAWPPALARVEERLRHIESKLADPAIYGDERRLARALEQQEAVLEEREDLGGHTHGSRVRALLAQLGLDPPCHEMPTETLSGGQKKLVALVRLAAAAPDLLLLDEPDNHLDLEAKQQLERFIRDYPGSVVLVSHDRYLLDSSVDRIAELDGGRFALYNGGYTAYASERELRRLAQRKKHADQQKEIARIEASIRRFELWASLVVNERHIKQARSRRKALERMEASGELVDAVPDERRIRFALEGSRGSRKALEIRGLVMGYDDLLFDDLDLLVRHGERVGLVGPNGCGKSVLLSIVRGEIEPWEGTITIGPSTRVGYYAQEHQTLDAWLDRSPLEWVRDAAPMQEGAAVSLLLRFLFQYEQLRQPIHALSGGERSRLQLARIVLEKPNLLLLDEPTNHLDIASAEVLESVLDDFEGAILVVSHDRYFLDQVVDRIEAFENGRLVSTSGGYTDYLEARRAGPGS